MLSRTSFEVLLRTLTLHLYELAGVVHQHSLLIRPGVLSGLRAIPCRKDRKSAQLYDLSIENGLRTAAFS